MPDRVRYLQIGDVLQLQFAPPSENVERFAATLIGFMPGQSLVITTPRKNARPIIVRDGQSFTVRMLQGSNIFGFVAQVLNASSKPYPHLHLSYPSDVESAVVRNAPRVPTEIDAQVVRPKDASGNEVEQPVIITDISSTGARVIDKQSLGKVGDVLQVMYTLKVCGGEDTLKIMSVIRNIREVAAGEGRKNYIHGLEFRGLNRFQQLVLCSYVLGSIARERG
ncbi:flagellar brake protein [Candidatus Thiodiazotropha sp. CDECU1]|uniref:flagellar brake protein n=1 Tax=Candidatus Thiodiazotropha sp. CDECU1 TaxID=3065865 RepID=UPI00292DD5A8|nr:flagellar brake protein [Candidatus Thiodiazotropha sp. CDECU1]